MKKRLLALFMILALSLTPILSACGGSSNAELEANDGEGGDNATTEDVGGAEEADDVPAYNYPELNMNGRDFRILNCEPVWNFTTNIFVEEATGEVLNDAIFNRNKFIEDKFNINITELNMHIDQIESKTKTSVQAGDDAYDVIFCPRSNNAPIGALITQGLFLNLDNIPELNLDGGWWKGSTIESSRLGDNNGVYFLQSEIALMTLQGVWCLFFNETMMQNLGLEYPYQLAKDGKWTLDELQRYLKVGTNLNGDETFNWTANGSSVYGLTSPVQAMAAFVTGIDEPYIRKDKDTNLPYLSIESERFYSGIEKILEITSVPGQYIEANEDRMTSTKNYEKMFEMGRALFIIAEFKSADLFRGMEDSLGIVPMPKYDESQANYSHMLFRQCPVMVIPQTNTIPHETGTIMDAMEYRSNVEVTPAYYDVTLSFKGLRNDDSIEMMHIINNTISLDLGITYNWTRQLYDEINDDLSKGKINLASRIDKRKTSIESSIEKTLYELENMNVDN